MYKKIEETNTVLATIAKHIGHTDWFISGSFANVDIPDYNDIDVYFLTKTAYTKAFQKCAAEGKCNPTLRSGYADIVLLPNIASVQFIHKQFGTLETIFEDTDLNVCKQAVFPNGSRIWDRGAKEPLRIDKVNYATFNRYLKYARRYAITQNSEFSIDKIMMSFIDTYINNTSKLDDYYNNTRSAVSVNQAVFELFQSLREYHLSTAAVDYILGQVQNIAPELLFTMK